MTLLEEIENYFGTKDLYSVIGVDKSATDDAIKKAYRKTSLKIHPDRVSEDEKEEATKRFQVLAQVHFVLSDQERRKLYDDHGLIANDEGLQSEADWANYWRLLFPKISDKDIKNFLDTYSGSKEEEEDLIRLYERFKGDVDKISETHITFDEEETTAQLKELIKQNKIPAYEKFTKESKSKKDKRNRRADREAKEAEKMREEMNQKAGKDADNMGDLHALIKAKHERNFDSMIAGLEAKYGNSNKKGVKRKRKD